MKGESMAPRNHVLGQPSNQDADSPVKFKAIKEAAASSTCCGHASLGLFVGAGLKHRVAHGCNFGIALFRA